MIIESRAPTRVDLAGATLDIWPLYLFHPGALTVNVAISRYASCVIETNASGNDQIKLVSRDTKREETFSSLAALAKAGRYRLPLLAEIVKFFQPQGGFHAHDGLGSSRGRWHRGLQRHGRGHLRRARSFHRRG